MATVQSRDRHNFCTDSTLILNVLYVPPQANCLTAVWLNVSSKGATETPPYVVTMSPGQMSKRDASQIVIPSQHPKCGRDTSSKGL